MTGPKQEKCTYPACGCTSSPCRLPFAEPMKLNDDFEAIKRACDAMDAKHAEGLASINASLKDLGLDEPSFDVTAIDKFLADNRSLMDDIAKHDGPVADTTPSAAMQIVHDTHQSAGDPECNWPDAVCADCIEMARRIDAFAAERVAAERRSWAEKLADAIAREREREREECARVADDFAVEYLGHSEEQWCGDGLARRIRDRGGK